TAAELAAVQLSTGVEDWGASGAVSWATTGVRLLKLHGSIGWTATSSEPPRALQLNHEQFDPRPPDLSRREPPAVIYGKRGKLRGDGPYLELRAAFARELREVDCLVTIGYSFADDHVNALIRRWLNGEESRWIVSVDPSPAMPPFGFDPTFTGELARLIPRAHDFARTPDKRPQFYRLEQTAAEAIPRVCLPAEDLRSTFDEWERQLRSTS
nr:SIR2 family protein [Candidatus Nanopelagicales bacterium]